MAKDLLQNILQVDPLKRFDIEKILSHPWCNLTKPRLDCGIIIGIDSITLDEEIVNNIMKDMEKYKGLRSNKTITHKDLISNLHENHHNCLTAT
jgi:hypothetical protein